jgi:two-component system, chemotaxis family, protein-glutamate methylesterase/glutaminase
MKKIRVLVIDDSLFMRQMIADILNANSDIEVVAEAKDGAEGLEKLMEYNPDVVTLDYEMPGLNGIATLKKIMRQKPTPVVMISAHTRKSGVITINALHEGAIDYVLKPSGSVSLDITRVGDEIVHRIKVAAKVDVVQLLKFLEQRPVLVQTPKILPRNMAVGIGSSTGGLVGVERILSSLPSEFPAAIFVVQHLPELFMDSFVRRLDEASGMQVKEAENGEQIKKGVVYISPGGYHMEVTCTLMETVCPPGEAFIQLSKSPKICGFRPSINVLLKSLAEVYGERTIGVLLSGMGIDGVEGMESIVQTKGKTLVQDKDTSVIFGMASAAIDIGAVDEVLPVQDIAKRIVEVLEMKK